MDYYSISLPDVTPIKLVTGKATYGIGFLTAFVGGFCALFGLPNNMFTQKLKNAEALAMDELHAAAKAAGADGVMDVRCQIDGLTFLVSGTAYRRSPAKKESHEDANKVTAAPVEHKEERTDTVAVSATKSGTIICPHCNFEQPGNRKVCWNCGAKFEKI